MIVNALHEVGAARSIVIDEDGNILAGNATIEAAVEAGIENLHIIDVDGETILAARRTGLTPEQKKRLAYFDNRAADVAEWSADQILADLASGFDLVGLFTEAELTDFGWEPDKAEDPGAQMDKADELQEKWQVKRGDVWTVGNHRVMCGDATDAEDVKRLMGGEKAQLMLADPPYNVGYQYAECFSDNKGADEYAGFCAAYFAIGMAVSQMQVITPGKSNERLYQPDEWMTWYKGFGTSRGHYFKAMVTEPILLFGRKPTGSFYATDHFDIHTDRIEGLRELHACPKPIALFAALIEPMTKQEGIVYDPFLGSGTTMVAAENLGRLCRGMEIEPRYVAVCLERMSGLGLSPVLSE